MLNLLEILRKSRVFKFLVIGGGLYILSVILMYLFEEKLHLGNTKAYEYQTIITYVLQFGLNAVFTWADRKVPLVQNLGRVLRYLPIKVILWGLSQLVFAFWSQFPWHYQVANMITVLTIMGVNYVVFDKLIFIGSKESTKRKRKRRRHKKAAA